jgi:hypothetical protein
MPTKSFKLNATNTAAESLVQSQAYLLNAVQECDFSDTGLKIRTLPLSSIAYFPNPHNTAQFMKAMDNKLTEEERANFLSAIAGQGGLCRRLFIGTVLSTGDMEFLWYLIFDRGLTDEDLPLWKKTHRWTDEGIPIPSALEAFIETESLMYRHPLNHDKFRESDKGEYLSSLPFSSVVRDDALRVDQSGMAAYRVELIKKQVDSDFKKTSYVLTEFPDEFPESIRQRGVAGFVCEGKWYLLSDLPHGSEERE